MYSSKILDIIYETACNLSQILVKFIDVKNQNLFILSLITLITCFIIYKIYSTFYVFSSVFKVSFKIIENNITFKRIIIIFIGNERNKNEKIQII